MKEPIQLYRHPIQRENARPGWPKVLVWESGDSSAIANALYPTYINGEVLCISAFDKFRSALQVANDRLPKTVFLKFPKVATPEDLHTYARLLMIIAIRERGGLKDDHDLTEAVIPVVIVTLSDNSALERLLRGEVKKQYGTLIPKQTTSIHESYFHVAKSQINSLKPVTTAKIVHPQTSLRHKTHRPQIDINPWLQ